MFDDEEYSYVVVGPVIRGTGATPMRVIVKSVVCSGIQLPNNSPYI